MSQENVEIVGRMLAAWERGDFETGASWHSPDIQFETFMPDSNERRRAEGLAGLEVFGREWFSQWREYRIVADDVRAVGDEQVFAAVRQFGIGKQSGAVVESDGYVVCTLREGRITKMSLHYDRAEALEAVGLSE
jgi:ketosteroid isomerase-like protein